MPRARATTQPPQIDPIRFGDLAEGDLGSLAPRADLESTSFHDVSLSGLDLGASLLSGVRFDGLVAAETDLAAARLSEVELSRVDLPVVRAARGTWRDVTITGRIGSMEAYESDWRSVHFVGCKIGFLNLRSAEILDVAFTDCVIEELDLLHAVARRVNLRDTTVQSLNVQHAELADVDLRSAQLRSVDGLMDLGGATINPDQLAMLAPLIAAGIGLRVED
jgi:uncharacterized protein YjbI with pentapeptide repeats